MATTPNTTEIFVSWPVNDASTRLGATPSTDRASPTSIESICTGDAYGSKVFGVIFRAISDTVAGLLQVWYFDTVLGSWVLMDEVAYDAVTVSDTVPGAKVVWTPPVLPFPLPDSHQLGFTVTDASDWHAVAVASSLKL